MMQSVCSAKIFLLVRDSESVVNLSPQACLWGTVILLSVPVRWVMAWLFAAIWHECFHCIALLILGKRIQRIQIRAIGAVIQTDPLKPWEAVLCASAGPLAGLMLLQCAEHIPHAALCALLQSVFNFLPIYPLDGSVIVRGIVDLFFSKSTADKMCYILEIVAYILVFLVCGVTAFLLKQGLIPMFFAILFLIYLKKRKIPCKYGLYRVQ